MLSATEPFTRSSLVLDDDLGLLKLYLIDRNFQFISYCFEGYLRDIINVRQVQKLDLYIVQRENGGTCSDLKQITLNDTQNFLILFCLSSGFSLNGTKKEYLTIVQIQNYNLSESNITYYTQDYDKMQIDFGSPVRFIANMTQTKDESPTIGLFMARISKEDKDGNLKLMPTLIWIDFTIFDDMRFLGETNRYDPDSKMVFESTVDLVIKNLTHPNGVLIDYKRIFMKEGDKSLYHAQVLLLAFVIEAKALLLCQVENYTNLIQSSQSFNRTQIECIQNDNAFSSEDSGAMGSGAMAVHYEPNNPDEKLFLITASPPRVIEFDITDFRNFYISNVYMAQEEANKRYVAVPVLAVNKHQVNLLMRDIYTNTYSIRIFCRDTSFFKIVQQDIILPPQSRPQYFAFPNFYFDKMLFRDERTVNITQAIPKTLVIDRSESSLEVSNFDLTDHVFDVQIYLLNQIDSLTSFQVTFIDQYNTDIYLMKSFNEADADIFYSCGDKNFTYDLTELFNGPSYSLGVTFEDRYIAPIVNESYFQIRNAQQKVIVNTSSMGVSCLQFLIVPLISNNIKLSNVLLMICINKHQAEFTSYMIYTDNEEIITNLTLGGNITIPEAKVLDYVYDSNQRVLIALIQNMIQNETQFLNSTLELHYFSLESCIAWKYKQPLNDLTYQTGKDLFVYSSDFKSGIFIINGENDILTNETQIQFHKFQFDFKNFQIIDFRHYNYSNINGRILKAQMTEKTIFITLMENNCLNILQIFPKVVKSVKEHSSQNLSRKIINFDILNKIYLTAFYNDSITEVYTLDYAIEITFRMRLPKYRKYENFTYYNYTPSSIHLPQIKRNFFEDSLAVPFSDPITKQTSLLIYQMDELLQHNSLYVETDKYSSIFSNTSFTWIFLTGDSEDIYQHFMGLASDNGFLLLEISYDDMLKVNYKAQQELIQSCNMMPGLNNNDGRKFNLTTIVSSLSLTQNSSLDNQYSYISSLNLTVKSNNQAGLALQSQTGASDFQISYQNSKRSTENLIIILESFVQGYNMDFKSNCSYKNSYENSQQCDSALVPNLTTHNYQFPIDFVTQKRQVSFQFPLLNYLMIIDSNDTIAIMKLPDRYDLDIDETQNGKRPLETVNLEMSQSTTFGCKIQNSSNFATILNVNQSYYKNQEIFLFMYQCLDKKGSKTLNAVEISVFKNETCTQTSQNCITMRRFQNSPRFVYDILDLSYINMTISQEQQGNLNYSSLSYSGQLAVVCIIEETYTNLLMIYSLELNGSVGGNSSAKNFQKMELLKINSANRNLWDSFKVNTVSKIPNTMLLLASVDMYGVIIYHTGINEIIYKINITETESITAFSAAKRGFRNPLRVFDTKISVPNQIFVFSNYGIYVYNFNFSLQDEEQMLRNKHKNGMPELSRVHLLPFDIESAQVISSPYGYAVLANQPIGRGLYNVKLMGIALYAGQLSKIHRTINITSNRNCTSFRRNQEIESSTQDQLAVSFICESRLYMVLICLRPHLIIDMRTFENITNLSLNQFQYNEFNITLSAVNDYSEENVNQAQAHIKLNYFGQPDHWQGYIIYFCVALFIMMALIIFLFFRSRMEQQQVEEEENDSTMKKYQESMDGRKSIMFYRQSSSTLQKSSSMNKTRLSIKNTGIQDDDLNSTQQLSSIKESVLFLDKLPQQLVDGSFKYVENTESNKDAMMQSLIDNQIITGNFSTVSNQKSMRGSNNLFSRFSVNNL